MVGVTVTLPGAFGPEVGRVTSVFFPAGSVYVVTGPGEVGRLEPEIGSPISALGVCPEGVTASSWYEVPPVPGI